jgi:type IV secretion system protein VirD4
MRPERVRIAYWDRSCRETLWYPHDAHLMLTAAGGMGKFRDVLCALGALWRGSMLWVDPKLQAGSVLARHIAKTHDVQFLNPFRALPDFVGRYPHALMNPLGTLDPTLDSFGADCDGIGEGIVTEQSHAGHDNHFVVAAKDGLSGLIAALVKHGAPHERNLGTARQLICSPQFFDFCREIVSKTNDPYIRQKLGRFTTVKAEENREILGIVSTMITQSAFIGNKAIADNLSESTFRWRDLKKRPTCIFLGLPARYLSSCDKWFRLIVATAMNQLLHEERGVPVLMVLDEFAQLGRLKVIENAMALARGYGVQLLPVLQDLNQLKGLYGDSYQTFLANAGCRMFFGSQDKFTSEIVSDLCGETEVRTMSRTMNRNARGQFESSMSIAPHAQKYLRPEAVRELPGDEMLVFAQGIPGVIRAGRRPYYLSPELNGMWDPDPYHIPEPRRPSLEPAKGLWAWLKP